MSGRQLIENTNGLDIWLLFYRFVRPKVDAFEALSQLTISSKKVYYPNEGIHPIRCQLA